MPTAEDFLLVMTDPVSGKTSSVRGGSAVRAWI
jgi:hypothetical protein